MDGGVHLNTGEQAAVSLYDMAVSYLDLLWRRKLVVAILFPLLFMAGLAVVVSLPSVYRSSALILIEGQEIPQELVKSTVTSYAEKQIEVIKQRVLTVSKINEMVKEYGLYSTDRQLTPSELAVQFRENLAITMISSELPGQWGRTTKTNIAFEVAFLDDSPQRAQKVASHLVTLFLDENVRSRLSKAAETSAFLKEEADKMQQEVSILEERVASFKAEFANSLPDMLDFNLRMVASLEEKAESLEENFATSQEQLRFLIVELANTPRHADMRSSGGEVSPESRLAQLRSELSLLELKYAQSHPSVQRVIDEISVLESTLPKVAGGSEPSGATNPIFRQIQNQITQAEGELSRLTTQQADVKQELDSYRLRVERTHQVEKGYVDLTRDYESKLGKYQELRQKQLAAEVSESLEAENKSESFSLVEPPQVPDFPSKPNRTKLSLMVLVVSIGASVGVIFAFELLSPRVRGAASLASVTGAEPLLVMPYITNSEDIRRNKVMMYRWLISFLVLVAVGLLFFHFFVMPIDVLTSKVLAKLARL